MFRHELNIEVFSYFKILDMNLEDFLPFLQLRKVHVYLPVETSCTHESLVQNICTVRSCKNNYAGIGTETIHLRKELVKSVFPLVIRREPGILATCATDSVNLVNEYDTRSFLLGLTEQVTYT